MADLTKEAFDALEKENQELRDQLSQSNQKQRELVEAHAQVLRNISDTVKHGGAVVIRPTEPVDGEFTVKYNHPMTGKSVQKKVRFKDGHQRVRLADGEIVGASALMRIAEGGVANEKELKTFPALSKLTKNVAAARLTDLVKMNYPHLVEVN